jgi:hypothetical protein
VPTAGEARFGVGAMPWADCRAERVNFHAAAEEHHVPYGFEIDAPYLTRQSKLVFRRSYWIKAAMMMSTGEVSEQATRLGERNVQSKRRRGTWR